MTAIFDEGTVAGLPYQHYPLTKAQWAEQAAALAGHYQDQEPTE